MSRLADYFVIVGYDHEKEREYTPMHPLNVCLGCEMYNSS